MNDPTAPALVSPADAHTQAEWEKIAAAVLRKSGKLKDTDPDSAVWLELAGLESLAGIDIPPLGTPELVADLPATGEPGAAPYARGRTAERPEHGWDIRPVFSVTDPKLTNEAILVDLENGATSLWLDLTGGVDGLATVLDGVLLDLAPVTLDGPDPVAGAEEFVAVLKDRGVTPAEGTNLGADPIGAAVRAGTTPDLTVIPRIAELAREAGTLALVVDATAVHDLGAAEYLELPYALAVGATYLRELTEAGLGVDEALGLIEFRYAATDDQFVTVAKLRAARLLWNRVGELSGASAAARGQRQHVVTSRPMMTKYDPWVNMLRTTVAAFAAGVGGADAVTVLPFDAALGLPDAFSRRIARNTSSLLISESHVAKVVDPAGGSYAVEKMTDDFARGAWALLGEIEEDGGIMAALADGSFLGLVGDAAAARASRIRRRQWPITGVTEFPNLTETLPERAPYPEATPQVARYAADFEALRDEPAATPVFLATMGTVAEHTARATFASNLLAAGGIAVESAGATSSVDDVLRQYAGQPVVCLAGPDPAYSEWGGDLVAALRDAGASWVILAGKPSPATIEPGEVDDSCAMGVDALAFCTRTREKLA